MTLNKLKRLSLYRLRSSSRSLLFVTLLPVVGSVHAQKSADTHGWAVSPKNIVEVTSDVSPSTNEEKALIQTFTEQEIKSASHEDEISRPGTIKTAEGSNIESLGNFSEKPIIEPNISLKTSISLNLELKETLNRQFQAIQKLAETEDSFNEQFGELYLAYARSLLKVGRLDNARKMFANALHNAKINHGVNSTEQRPVLRELFTMSLARGNAVDAEKQLKRLIWLDSGTPEDTYSFDAIMQLAHYYLDQHLMAPIATETSLISLHKAIRYYGYAIRRYSDIPTKQLSLPYGDFAYAHYLKTQIRSDVDAELYVNARKRSYTGLDKLDSRHFTDNSFSQSNRYLRIAYNKAKKERDFERTIKTLLNIGDIHLLYGSEFDANTYYQLAKKSAKHLPKTHPIVKSFDGPVELPAFELTVKRAHLLSSKPYQIVPMQLDVNTNGYIGTVTRQSHVDIPMGMRIRAKDAAKRLRFRPIIETDRLVSVDDYHYDVKVPIRKRSALANKGSEESVK